MLCSQGGEHHLHHSTLPTCSKIKTRHGGSVAHHFTTLGLLWRDSFRELLQFKTCPISQDFQHSITERSTWLQCCYNPCWVQGELRKRGPQPAEREEGGGLDVEWTTNKVNSISYRAQQQEEEEEEDKEVLIVGEDNHEVLIVGEDNHEAFLSAVSLVALLKACATQKDLHRGHELHDLIVRNGFLDKNIFIGSALVSMYAKCGALLKAREVFDELPFRNTVSWTALIAGYAQHGHGEEALKCYEEMLLHGFSPNAVTFVCALKACGSIGDLDTGEQIHSHILNDSLLKINIVVANALVGMYAKCGALVKAQELFEEMRVRDIVSWTTLIAGFAQHGHGEEALSFFERMQHEGYGLDAFALVCALDACGSVGAVDKCQSIHIQIIKVGLLEKDSIIGNALVNAYANCGALAKAQEVFDELLVRDVVSWNSLIAGYSQHERGKEALNCFEQMQLEGFCPDAITYAVSLKACGSILVVDKCQHIHAHIVKAGLLERQGFVGTSMVDTYAKCGCLAQAHKVFDELRVQDMVSWTSLITGYAQHAYYEEALCCFEWMQIERISPDVVTFARIAQACGSLGATYKGLNVHAELVRYGLIEHDMAIGVGLIDMYASCGMLAEAQDVFNKICIKNVVSWSALMTGYAQFGKDEIVFNLFNEMIGEGTQPDLVTFTVLLNTCCHRGLFDKGQLYFELISEGYGIVPTLEHHTCMVDLLGRAGHFELAVAMIEKMPFLANLTLWHTLLGALGNFGYSKLARWAYEHAAHLNETDATAYVGMSNIYASAGR